MVSQHTENFWATAKSSFDLKVKGDLSAEQLADIQTLLEKFEDLASDFFSGSRDTSGTGLVDILSSLASEDLDTITSFDALLKFSQRIREEYGRALPSPVSGSTDPGQTPTTAEGIYQFVNNLIKETRETPPLRERLRQSDPVGPPPPSRLPRAQKDTLSQLAGMLNAVLDKPADQQDFGTSKRKLATHVRAEFVQKLKFSLKHKETLELGP